jgi:ferritin-like metal-binding protein YciE
MKTINSLLSYELGELLYAKRQIFEALRKLHSVLSDPNVKDRIEQHMAVVKRHAESLSEARDSLSVEGAENQNLDLPLESFLTDDSNLKKSFPDFEIGAYNAAIMIAEALHDFEGVELLKKHLQDELETRAHENNLELMEGISDHSQLDHLIISQNRGRKESL